MNKLIALRRLRQEGFQTEAFEDDFIMDVPEELIRCFSPRKALKYCEKKFREAAQATIIGPNCEKSFPILVMITTGAILLCI